MARPIVYTGKEIGAYGFHEKPWYQPGERLERFLAEVDAGGLTEAVSFREAPPASDDELTLFHEPDHVAFVTRRCAEDQGSLDRASDLVNQRSRRLLQAIADVGGPATAADLAAVLEDLHATLEAFAPFLESESLVAWDPNAGTVRMAKAGRAFLADPEASLGGPTYARRHVEIAARHVCGAVLDATRRILDGELSTAFVPIAGFHHAHRDQARMYCLYNDPALAIAAALKALDGPIAYIDVDIHRGDGVYEGFADDPRVIIADLHEAPPGQVEPGEARPTEHIGRGEARGTKLALALGRDHDDDSYLAAWDRAEAFVRAARPAFVIFEAGVDGLADDPMSHQQLTPAVFGEVTRQVRELADEHADGRLLVLGGGGYELEGMARGWAAVLAALT